jgi:TolA-binding protein
LRSLLLFVVSVAVAACASKPAPAPDQSPAPRPPTSTRTVRETVTVKDPELERRLSRAELRVMEKEAQVTELQTRLEDARDEVVRTMAKLQTLASRAEAASAMAEADVALQSLRNAEGARQLPELAQVTKFVQQSTAEFNKQNYGGALYLADQAKTTVTAARARLSGGAKNLRQGETQFAVPVRLKVANRGNVREGPGTSFPVVFAVEAGTGLTGFSYTDEWVRVTDDTGRSGWIFRSLVTRP